MGQRYRDGTLNVPGTGLPVSTHVRDAIYDRIPLAGPELSLMRTLEFLRLERIQQLGFVSRIWPGAKHARYEHSIGVLHLARLTLDHLRAMPDGNWISDEDARTIGAAALLHDIGHYPFSHAIEELGPPIMPHEMVGRRLIECAPLASDFEQEWRVDPARVAAIIDPKGRTLNPADQVLRSVPLRTARCRQTRLPAARCEGVQRTLRRRRHQPADQLAWFAEIEGSRRIVIGDKGVSPLHSLINARQEMFDNVYWHHTNRACMVMLLRAVQEAMIAGASGRTSSPTMTMLRCSPFLVAPRCRSQRKD